MNFVEKGNIVDIKNRRIFYGEIEVSGEKIISVKEIANQNDNAPFILPGFIDAHVHIESSMLVPSEFAKLAVVHGTVATISDPHEIANVCGMKGVEYMIENGKTVPFKFYFGAPSCVPATDFETAGASLNANDVDALLARDEINYLSEMMNFPGVLHHDEEVEAKINSAKIYDKPVDGHAPGLRGKDAKKYIDAGISTDHECFTKEEALEKLQYGMKILIREGSAAKNFEALIDLLNDYEDEMMFCSDDKHPDSLVSGHINELCKRAVAKGIDVFKVLKAACINPMKHYKMKVGLLKTGEAADFIVANDLVNFNVIKTFIGGTLVAENGVSKINSPKAELINNFNCNKKQVSDFIYKKDSGEKIIVIEALDGQLITNKLSINPKIENDCFVSDVENDILKIAVINRYKGAPTATGFVKNFGLRKGAIASSVAHDSHNIIAVGVDDESLCSAVNLIIESRGGVSCVDAANPSIYKVLPLPVAGLMSNEDGYEIADAYTKIDQAAKSLGSKLSAPFMTLSFMALLVIPHVKLSDLGLFDGEGFKFII
ncbi:adenine deaminase [Ginsengibacter hankyongi]|uniref:Adenine deaminase n=1 Tax=Ginsengibacter hankyongi TaxID=2607284 RepID=A0A5J5IGA2_9BACT|nr:adenine deaminase [Ginsengibacter hankyongi]KAA9039234.1 adenine deaminase [Ginsengibacter hankyongi]